MNKTIKFLFLSMVLISMVIIFDACKKNQEDAAPTISVHSPTELQEFYVGDSILVRASISSDIEITSVKVVLVNGGIPMLVPKYFYPGSTTFELEYMYPINEDIESGSYSLLISASHSSSTSKRYTEVVIAGSGRYFEQIIAVCRPNPLNTALYSIDANGSFDLIHNLQHSYTDSEISYVRQQFYFLRPSPSRLLTYNLEKWEQDYMLEASPPHPEFNSIFVADYPTLAYVPNGNGEIRGYDNVGLSAFVTEVNPDTVPLLCRKHDNKILAYSEYRGGPERFIRQYYSETGVYRVSLDIWFTALDFFALDPDINLVFGNDDKGGNAYVFDVTGNVITHEMSLGGGMIRTVVNTTENIYLFSMDQAIYSYDHDKPMIATWKSGIEASVIVFDDLRQLLYAAEGPKLYLYRYPDGLLLQEITLPNEILNLHIHYNK